MRRPAMAEAQRLAAAHADGSMHAARRIGPASRLFRVYGTLVASIIGLVALGGVFISVVNAVTWEGPTQAAPDGNIPVTVWNAESTLGKQVTASIDVDGTLSLGDTTLDLGISDTGQNLVYGYVPYGTMNAGDRLLLLETEASGVWTPRMAVDRDGSVVASGDIASRSGQFGSAATVIGASQNLVYGNVDTTSTGSLLLLQNESADRFRVDVNGNAKAAGSMTATGCFGASFVGMTTSGGTGAPSGTGVYKVGDILSYYGANNKCATNYPGAHACTVNEMLESIRCSVPTSPVRTSGGANAWVNGGPPGFTADANDCKGWTSNAASAYGRYWVFDNTTGGYGTMTSCNSPGLKIACCR